MAGGNEFHWIVEPKVEREIGQLFVLRRFGEA